jgi:uncharacterized oxidoreductase
MNINGKTALVTGGTDGIGIHIARQLQAKGATVIVCGRREDKLAAARAEGLEAISADLSNTAGVAALAAAMKTRNLDIVINNAGAGSTYVLGEPIDLAENDRTIFLNLNAPIQLIALLIDQLKARPAATIVNVSSGLAIAPNGRSAVYCATKAGLRSYTKSIRFQLRDTNVHVIEALPPVVDTAMTTDIERGKMLPQECARQIIAAIEGDRQEANVGMVKLLRVMHSISPRFADAFMIRY